MDRCDKSHFFQLIFQSNEQERFKVSFLQGKTHSWITLTIFISSCFPTILWGNMHQLQNKGSPGDNSSTSWEQIPPHKTFQHRTLSTALKIGIQLHDFLKHQNAIIF